MEPILITVSLSVCQVDGGNGRLTPSDPLSYVAYVKGLATGVGGQAAVPAMSFTQPFTQVRHRSIAW